MKLRALSRFATLARRYLAVQRRRTLLTVAALVMAVALVTASAVFGESLKQWLIEDIAYRHGSFHVTLSGATVDDLNRLRGDSRLDLTGATIRVGDMVLAEGFSALMHAPDETWISGMHTEVTRGRFPEASGEIAVEPWFFESAGKAVSIGDRVEMEIRLLSGELVSVEFLVVGFIAPTEGLYSAGVATAVLSVADGLLLSGSRPEYIIGTTIRDGLPLQETIGAVMADMGAGVVGSQNTALLSAMGGGVSNTMNTSIRRVERIVALIVLAATVTVVYNSFAISILERIRQFGILRTVGATPGQIRRLVFREAAIIALIGTPIGLAAGFGAVRLVILAFNLLTGVGGFSGISMSYPLSVLVGGPTLALVAVTVSAWFPARAASRVSPMEAVVAHGRFVKDRTRRRPQWLLTKLFGISGKMAGQNLRRIPGRLAVTVLSIAVGIALFVTFASLFQILTTARNSLGDNPLQRDIDVQLSHLSPQAISPAELASISGLPNVRAVLATTEIGAFTQISPNPDDSPDGHEVDEDTSTTVREAIGGAGPVVPVTVIGVNESAAAAMRPRILEGEHEFRALSDQDGVLSLSGAYEIGDTVSVYADGAVTSLVVAGILSATPPVTTGDVPIVLVTSDEVVARLWPQTGFRRGSRFLSVELESPEMSDDSERAIRTVLGGERPEISIVNWAQSQRQRRSLQLQIAILLYGLVAVVTLIGALNIVNTITTELILRVREFGTLRSIGMTRRQIRAMVRIEATLYALYAALIGSAAGVVLTRLLYRNVYELQAIPWESPLQSVGIAVLGALIITLASTVYPMARLERVSIVDSIRAAE